MKISKMLKINPELLLWFPKADFLKRFFNKMFSFYSGLVLLKGTGRDDISLQFAFILSLRPVVGKVWYILHL